MDFRVERVNPERLRLVLQDAGWTIAGQRTGVYVRMLPPEEAEHSVLVPLDRDAPEYSETMTAALADIRRLAIREAWAPNVAARLVVEPSDGFRFRAESAAPAGLIAWTHGERLIASSRRILAAGAKTHLEHLKYFGNKFGQFANRYLDAILMGQTAPGSYVVTAYSPANGFVQVSGGQRNITPLFELADDLAPTRAIGISVMGAAEAAREALDHYRARGSLTGFEMIERGISYELTTALSDLVAGSDGADISVEWDPVLEPPANAPASRIEFRPSDVEVLGKASVQLASAAEQSIHVTVMGRVHLLTQREAGGPGVVGIENLSGTAPKRLRVHLNDDDYHLALRAHDRNDAIIVAGDIQREGNIHWVYNGRVVSMLGAIEDIATEVQGSYSSLKERGRVKGGVSWGFAG